MSRGSAAADEQEDQDDHDDHRAQRDQPATQVDIAAAVVAVDISLGAAVTGWLEQFLVAGRGRRAAP